MYICNVEIKKTQLFNGHTQARFTNSGGIMCGKFGIVCVGGWWMSSLLRCASATIGIPFVERTLRKHDGTPPLLLEPKRNDLPRWSLYNSDKLSFTRIFWQVVLRRCLFFFHIGREQFRRIILTKAKWAGGEQKSDSVPGRAIIPWAI